MKTFDDYEKEYFEIKKPRAGDSASALLERLQDWFMGFREVPGNIIKTSGEARRFLNYVREYRLEIAETWKLNGCNFPALLKKFLSGGEEGMYSDDLSFLYELVQNVDDCEYESSPELEMHFDFNNDKITLKYNETGFTPFNVYAITGIAETAKNLSDKTEIGEKGIGFKSVFGISRSVLIKSGYFSFRLYEDKYTLPEPEYNGGGYVKGTEMTLFLKDQNGGEKTRAHKIYNDIFRRYCKKEGALFTDNPLLFLHKLTKLVIWFDTYRNMIFTVTRKKDCQNEEITKEENVRISVGYKNRDSASGESSGTKEISCVRYTMRAYYSREDLRSRYGEDARQGFVNGKHMYLRAIVPDKPENMPAGSLYSFLPTKQRLTVPVLLDAPFKLNPSREYIVGQGNNLWFEKTCSYLGRLTDYVYNDLAKTKKEKVIYYLPKKGAGLFASGNGREECFGGRDEFCAGHFLNLPLFYVSSGEFKRADEVFSFKNAGGLNRDRQKKLCSLLGISGRSLFIPPEGIYVSEYGIETEKDGPGKLLRKALKKPGITKEALDFLDGTEGFEYGKEDFGKTEDIIFTTGQTEELFRHKKLISAIINYAAECFKNPSCVLFGAAGEGAVNLDEILSGDLTAKDLPEKVQKYLKRIGNKCVLADTDAKNFLPCRNVLVLSGRDPLCSVSEFCGLIDKNHYFNVRYRLRGTKTRLDRLQSDNSVSDRKFLEELRNIRLLVRDVLGKEAYRNYIKLITDSGTDGERFICELLQNADDCEYESSPEFSYKYEKGKITVRYNEKGFSRADVRAITGIGESTKSRILKPGETQIGEKGIGFKSVFAVAPRVEIKSGGFAFALTDREPTIPEISGTDIKTGGTEMTLTLKKDMQAKFGGETKNTELLRLCLCLRKLKKLTFGNKTVTISDGPGYRKITVDGRAYGFKKFSGTVDVPDGVNLKRAEAHRRIQEKETVTCYVPDFEDKNIRFLYSGLPTKQRISIPMAIDAPFELTTSREHVGQPDGDWAGLVLRKIYDLIAEAIDKLKFYDGIDVLRFVKIEPADGGYANATFEGNGRLNKCDLTGLLKERQFLPTYEENYYVSPRSGALVYPEIINELLNKKAVSPDLYKEAINTKGRSGREAYKTVLKAFGIKEANPGSVIRILENDVAGYNKDEKILKLLYGYIRENTEGSEKRKAEFEKYREHFKNMEIIPVCPEDGRQACVSWKRAGGRIYVRREFGVPLPENSYILNEKLMPKGLCEWIGEKNIQELTREYARHLYREQLKRILSGNDSGSIYMFLLKEYREGHFLANDSLGTLMECGVPLKNLSGEISRSKLFICGDQSVKRRLNGRIKRIVCHDECAGLAEYVRCGGLSKIGYDDLPQKDALNLDEATLLNDDYFKNRDAILHEFYNDGLLPDWIVDSLNIGWLRFGSVDTRYTFPEEAAGDIGRIKRYVNEGFTDPVRIIKEKILQTVDRGQKKAGDPFPLEIKEARDDIIRSYAPAEGGRGICCCQMCGALKNRMFIEVNNIESEPEYFFRELRLALCLECSKKFEAFRDDRHLRDRFLENIRNYPLSPFERKVSIEIKEGYKITFTGKHFAVVRELLKRIREEKERNGEG